MEQPMQAPSAGQTPPSEFSGQKYNPDQNSVKHYKAGKKPGKPKNQKKKIEKQLDGAASVKTDGNKYSNGRQPDYVQASVFKNK